MRLKIGVLVSLLVTSLCQSEEFTPRDAQANLNFAMAQYAKMMEQVERGQHLQSPQLCQLTTALCMPRALHGDEIQMALPGKWTNGFYPGVFWKLLSSSDEWTEGNAVLKQQFLNHAVRYQQRLYPEVWRTNTHDLGFIAYDSFGEALNYSGLPTQLRQRYERALVQARESLYQRYDPNLGVIQSWDWLPAIQFVVRGQKGIETPGFELAQRWKVPVIIDNMMNLELLLTSAQSDHQQAALSHAQRTQENHYFTVPDESGAPLTLAYHLYDHELAMPGNWQGLGNRSAWSRGQGWSLYGFVTLLEFQQQLSLSPEKHQDFLTHTKALLDTLERLLKETPVPDWDFFAGKTNARDWILDDQGLRYSPMQDLCASQLEEGVLPYTGHQPLPLPIDLLSDSAKNELSNYNTLNGDPLTDGTYFYPCGDVGDKRTRHGAIPKDTSAAALLASALYRLGLNPDWPERQRAIALADHIMNALTRDYLSHRVPESAAYQRGFVLTQATGNMPAASEIDTGIVYADFYFIEANQLKLRLSH